MMHFTQTPIATTTPLTEVGNYNLPAHSVFTCSDCGETFGGDDVIVVEYFHQRPVGVYHDRCAKCKADSGWRRFAMRCMCFLNKTQISEAAQAAGVHATFCDIASQGGAA